MRALSSSRGSILALSTALVACGASPTGRTTVESATPATSTRPAPPTPGTPAATGRFEVHEWGVIDISSRGPTELLAGPGHPALDLPRPVRKPVLYFHLDEGAPPVDLTVEARLPRGTMIETWPRGEASRAAIRWAGLRLGPCPVPAPSVRSEMATLRASGWPTSDGFNEVFELPSYETSDASCLASGGTLARLLFYRGSVAPLSMPLSLVREADGRLGLRANVVGTGNVYFSAGGGRGLLLAWPKPGATDPLPEKLTESLDGPQLAEALQREITARGLTGPEANAFLAAWTGPFFGSASPGGSRDARESEPTVSRRGAPPSGPPPAIVYVMPEPTVAEIAELSITPAPRSLKRVMVVHHEVVR